MSIKKFLLNLFNNASKSPKNEFERTIKKMGYKEDGINTYVKEKSSGRTYIWIQDSGIKIKVYAYGYGESDFLPSNQLTVDRLKQFIRENEL